MMEFRRKQGIIVVYEPVAYDKRIEAEGDLWRPIVRHDDKELRLPATACFLRAQATLDMFAPDVFEGTAPGNSVYYKADRRFAENAECI